MSNKNNISTGSSGEYFVAAELERRGYTVAMPMANTPVFDILAIHRESGNQVAIQVKTTSYRKKRWTLGKRNEDQSNKGMVYVFVVLNELEIPEYHIVPSTIVSEAIKKSYRQWLNTPGKNGQKHNETTIRNFWDTEDLYLNKWENLRYWEE